MSEFVNGLKLLSDLDEAGLRAKLGVDADDHELEYAFGKKIHLDFRKSSSTEAVFGQPPDFVLLFDTRQRGTRKSPEELIGEVGLVLNWIQDSHNCSAGLYHIEGMPFVHWSSDEVVVNATTFLWETPESRLLRQSLLDRDITYTVRKEEGPSRDYRGIRKRVHLDARPPYQILWPELFPGSLELASSANALGFRFDRGSCFMLPITKGNLAEVDIAGLESLLEEIAIAVENKDDRIADLERWQSTIVDLVALLILNNKDALEEMHSLLQRLWGELAAQRATEISAQAR